MIDALTEFNERLKGVHSLYFEFDNDAVSDTLILPMDVLSIYMRSAPIRYGFYEKTALKGSLMKQLDTYEMGEENTLYMEISDTKNLYMIETVTNRRMTELGRLFRSLHEKKAIRIVFLCKDSHGFALVPNGTYLAFRVTKGTYNYEHKSSILELI